MKDDLETSFKNLLNSRSFAIYAPNITLTQEILGNIYETSSFFSQPLKNYSLSGNNYDISFIDSEDTISIEIINKETKYNYLIKEIMKKPFEVKFENINEIKMEKLYIFKKNTYEKLILWISLYNNKILYEEDKKEKILIVKNINFKIPDEIIAATEEFKKNNDLKNPSELTILDVKINPLSLSSNFFLIFADVLKQKDFIFILNEERIELIKKLFDFVSSQKKFYYISGTDGIGKSLSLLYFSSLNIKRALYFNIKLYSKAKGEEEFDKIFSNDLHKFFLFKYKSEEKDAINTEFSNTMIEIKSKLKKTYKDNVEKLFNYIVSLFQCFAGEEYILVIDQYKSDFVDKNFEGLNSIINYILNYPRSILVKHIVSSSIDNTSNKFMLLRNLSNIYLDQHKNNITDLIYSESLKSINIYYNENINPLEPLFTESDDELNDKIECDFCEEIFKKEKETRKIQIKKPNESHNFIIDSQCLLDKYINETIKDYYSSLVNGKVIFKNLLNEKEYYLAENFNFSLKYIMKYINFKNYAIKKDNESEELFQDRIISEFYEKEFNKMKGKINNFYEMLFNKLDDNHYKGKFTNYFHLEFQTLCKLRSYIFYKKKFNIFDLAYDLLYFPMKYLKIQINDYDEPCFPMQNMELNYSFKIEYNNNFIRIQINKIIEELFKTITDVSIGSFRGSAEGAFLELKVNETFRKKSSNILGIDFLDLECRYLFSLVSNTSNSKETIKKHRINEAKLIFFGANNYNILIDDIDNDKLGKEHYNLKKKFYYFSQVSLTGKAFDLCIIERESDNLYKLYLLQISKNKSEELGSKFYYFMQANNVAKNLENLYNIKCSNKYLIFVLSKINTDSNFTKKLEANFFYYILFDIYTCQFYGKKGEEISSLANNDSILDSKYISEVQNYEKIKRNCFIWYNSMKSFINKNLNKEMSFHQIYIQNYYSTNIYHETKLNLPSSLSSLILNDILHEKIGKLKFIGNCNIKNIMKIKYINKILFLFLKDKKMYIYYNNLYLIKEKKKKFEYEITEDEIIKKETENSDLEEETLSKSLGPKKRYIIIQYNDLIKKQKLYNGKCFCYLVLLEQDLKDFYHYWC